MTATIVVLAKAPVPGRVKTRLTPAFTPGAAAELAAAALADTIGVVRATPGTSPVLALEGTPPLRLPADLPVLAQRGDRLASRIAAAFDDAYAHCGGPVVLIGMDTPQLTPDLLRRAVDALCDTDACLGPATDGGWWLLGLRTPDARAFTGVPMSSPRTAMFQRLALRRLDLHVTELDELRDVDTAADARAVAEIAPTTRFAHLVRELDARPAVAG